MNSRLPAAVLVPLLLLCALSAGSARAQSGLPDYTRLLGGVSLNDGSGPVPGPWLGGWETPRPQLEDADADGDLDLFVFEAQGRLRFYRNDGTPSAPDFVFVTDAWGGVHERYFGRVVDLEGDGDLDLLVEAPEFPTVIGGQTVLRAGAYLYTNVGTSSAPVLENRSTHPGGYLADVAGNPVPCVTTSPDFVDLEGDGDKDLVMGDPSGAVILYRNTGSAASPAFTFETDHYQDLLIVFGFCTGESADPVPLGEILERSGLRHGYMLFAFVDITGDGLPDLLLGDQFNSNVYFLENLGGTPDPGFACRTQDYFPSQPDFAQMLVTAVGDLDDDGDPDALIGSGVSSTTGLFRFRNDGSPSVPVWTLLATDALPEFDLGQGSAPAMADLDGGGIPDMYVATGSGQRVERYGNYGAPGVPVFGLDAPQWLPLPNAAWAAPEFADLDADGDLDRFVGMTSGAVRWWRNTGTATEPAFTEVTTDAAFGDVVGRTIRQAIDAQAVPRFLDDDGDGDLDLVMGAWSFSGAARLKLFRNDGTPQVPVMVLASSDWRGLGDLGQQIAPLFADLDGDGDRDLLIGRFDGTCVRVENTGTPAVPSFAGPAEPVGGMDVGGGAVPSAFDADGDGDLDLILGENSGGLDLFRADPSGAAPAAFALTTPAAGASVDGRRPVRFDWPAVIDPVTATECTYELRIAATPSAPPHEWRIIPGLAVSQADVVLHTGDFRFRPDFVWTVVAHGVRPAPVPAWRTGHHSTWDDVHGPDAPPFATDPVVRTPPTLGLTARPVPARESVQLLIALPADGTVTVEVFDVHGRRVATLRHSPASAGEETLSWNGRDDAGRPAAAGVYLVRVRQGVDSVTRRVVLLR